MKFPTVSLTPEMQAKVPGYLLMISVILATWNLWQTQIRRSVSLPEYMPLAGITVAVCFSSVMIS